METIVNTSRNALFLINRIKSRLLFPVLLLFGPVTFAQQRIVDLEAICISPSDTVVNGIGALLRFGAQNNGPDVMYHRDTILYWLEVIKNDTLYWSYSGAMLGTDDGTVEVGQSSLYNDNYAIRFPFSNRTDTFTVDFCVIVGSSYFDESGEAVHPFSYIDPDRTNNKCCRPVTIVPKPSTMSLDMNLDIWEWTLYPNPVSDRLYIRRSSNFPLGIVNLSIIDLSGRLMLEKRLSSNTGGQEGYGLDITMLPAGIYHIRIQSSEGVALRKIIIEK